MSDRKPNLTDIEHQLMLANVGQVVTHELIAQSSRENLLSSEKALSQHSQNHQEHMAALEDMHFAQEMLAEEIADGLRDVSLAQKGTNKILGAISSSVETANNLIVEGIYEQLASLERLREITSEASANIGRLVALQKSQAQVQGNEFREMALKLFPTAAIVDEERALKLYEEIATLLRRAIEANPTDFVALMNMGWINKNIYGDISGAIDLYEKASLMSLGVDKDFSIYCHRHLCVSQLHIANFDAALVTCDAALELAGEDGNTGFELFKVKALLGKDAITDGLAMLGRIIQGSHEAYFEALKDTELCADPRVLPLLGETSVSYKQEKLRAAEKKAALGIKKIKGLSANIAGFQEETDELHALAKESKRSATQVETESQILLDDDGAEWETGTYMDLKLHWED